MDTPISRPLLDFTFRGRPEDLAKERNIASLMSYEDRQKIGGFCLRGYQDDKSSRVKWEEWYAEAIKLALQVKEAKNFPWPGASNVKFPLLTVAALNAHAQAYPALIKGDEVCKFRLIGGDITGEKTARADRVGKHMSYQLMETLPWEEQTDKQILVHYILGTTFKKTYRDNTRRMNCSDLVMPQDLVINYFTKDMDTCPRASHVFSLTRNEMVENIQADVFLDPTTDPGQSPQALNNERPTGPLEAAKDKAQLTRPSPNLGLVAFLIEQSAWLDLDGDGYDEPYAITFDEQTGYVYRILARYYIDGIIRADSGRYKGEITKIDQENYYTKFILIPSPDGGAYGMGLGRFLAPINDAVDTIINQMLDANTMSILGGGFLGRGVKMKAGDMTFRPYQYQPVDMTGDDIRKSVMPLPRNDISPAALQLLQYLVEYGERIGSSGDIQMGKIKGYEKAQTMEIANENGKLIFNATFKRFWRSMKEEFKKLYKLNALYQEDEIFRLGEKEYKITKGDYSGPSSGVCPAADPNIVSKQERKATAALVLQVAGSAGFAGHDPDVIYTRFYEAHDVPAIAQIYPGLKERPPSPSADMIEAQVKMQKEKTRSMDVQNKSMLAAAKLQMEAKKLQVDIIKITAEINLLMKQADSLETGHKIALLQLKLDSQTAQRDSALATIQMLLDAVKDNPNADQSSGMGGVASASGDPSTAPVSQAA